MQELFRPEQYIQQDEDTDKCIPYDMNTTSKLLSLTNVVHITIHTTG